MHGGTSRQIGVANGSFKRGFYSEVLAPLGLREGYEARLGDTNLTSVRDQLAIYDARLQQLLGQLGADGIPQWGDAQEHLARYREAVTARNVQGMQESMRALEQVVDAGAADGGAWKEIYKVCELRCKAAAAESTMMDRLNQYMTQEQVGTLCLAVYQSVNTRLMALTQELTLDPRHHRQVMDGIGRDLRKLLLENTVETRGELVVSHAS